MTDEELKRLIEGTAEETRKYVDTVATRLDASINTVATRLDARIDSTAEETRRHFDVVAEQLKSEIQTVAEGVLSVNERLDRYQGEVKAEFVETRAMIKFSHHELDRRMKSLEDTVADLQTRVERLESTTH